MAVTARAYSALYVGFGPVRVVITGYAIAVIYEDVDQFGGEVANPSPWVVFHGLSNQVPLRPCGDGPPPRPSRRSFRPRDGPVTAPPWPGRSGPVPEPVDPPSFVAPERFEHVELTAASTVAVAARGW